MLKQQNQVRDFHIGVGAVVNKTPTVLDPATALLRYKLIAEELGEFYIAVGMPGETQGKKDSASFYGDVHPIAEAADAVCDLLYVVLGTAVSLGVNIEPLFDEVHRSNMSKLTGGTKRPDGKWLKGPDYSPANLTPLIEQQCQPTHDPSAPVVAKTASSPAQPPTETAT